MNFTIKAQFEKLSNNVENNFNKTFNELNSIKHIFKE